MLTVKGLRELLNEWEQKHNAIPDNLVYLGAFEDMPIVVPHYGDTATRGLFQIQGLGNVQVLNNPRCLGIEIWQDDCNA